MGFAFPDRISDVMKGSQFAGTVLQNVGQVRENAILQQLPLGNFPDFLRQPTTLSLSMGGEEDGHTIELQVLSDYFAIGNDDDFIRFPMFPSTAQRIANQLNATLPTRKLVDMIWKRATVVLSPHALPPSAYMISTGAYMDHNHVVELARAYRTGLVAGHKKDIVITPRLASLKDRVAIYGWHQLSGQPIQPLNPSSHSAEYVDYSHGVRFICRDVVVDGQPAKFEDVLADKVLSELISDEGPSTYTKYPV